MTTEELNTIVQAVVEKINGQVIDFDVVSSAPESTDLLSAVRSQGDGTYQGVTLKWDDVANAVTREAKGYRDEAASAKTNVENMKASVEQTVSDFNTLADEKKAEVQGVYQTDLNELKGDLADVKELSAYESNVIFSLKEETVSGTSTYVYKDFTVDTSPIVGEKYFIHFDKVIGASNKQPITIYLKNGDGTNIASIPSTSNVYENYNSNFTIPDECKTVVLRLYASTSGAVNATYYGIRYGKGEAESVALKKDLQDRFDSKADKEDVANILTSNVVIATMDKVVSGTGTYVFEDLFIENPIKNTTYTVKVSEIVGATNSNPLFIETMNGDTTIEKLNSASNQYSNVMLSINTTNDTTKIRIRLYPSTSGGVTATFKGVTVLVGNYTTEKKIFDSSILIESVEHLNSYTLETITSIAHRGYWKNSTECLPLAYINAKKMGFNEAENDLNISSDGEFVMWHDSDLHKIGLGYDALISNYTLAELKAMDFNGETIMTFKEWIYLMKRLGLKARIDFKISPTDEQVEQLVAIVRRAGMLEHCIWVANLTVRNYDPKATITLANPPTAERVEHYKSYLENGKVIFHFHINEVTEENVSLGLDNGYGVECWCMELDPTYGFNNHQDFVNAVSNAINCGIQGLSTDNNTVYSIMQEVGY